MCLLSLATLTAAILLAPGTPEQSSSSRLSFEQRVEAQRAIERVYWKHRIWPPENAAEKPPLEKVLSDEALRARVARSLKLSSALESVWGRPIGGDQLQAELRRMTTASRAPELLRELFQALNNDPHRIAETLARPALAERLARNAYAQDERFHGALRRRAEAALGKGVALREAGGEYRDERWVRLEACEDEEENCLVLPEGEWQRVVERLSGKGRILEEHNDGFRVMELLARGGNEATVAVASWRKVPFDVWWAAEEKAQRLEVAESVQRFLLLEPTPECTPDTWQPTLTDVPDARANHSMVWTGTEMIVWGGGASPFLVMNTGGRYDPATDTWRPVSTGPFTPAARANHTAVWTGTEMIVWGGDDGAETFHGGAAFDPAEDSWLPLPAAPGSPIARSGHTAVWTGNEMIVWGGAGAQVCSSGGARYDPAAGTWSEVSSAGPSARCGHTAVWTGTHMIVWGGQSYPPALLNTGGIYDPAKDSWAETSMGAGVPVPRTDHTAVWTGQEMIVYGGFTEVVDNRRTGARFDPATNAWVAIPDERSRPGHTAVWTGTEMIVWGDGDLGGRYDPGTNRWSDTASRQTNVSHHTVVWTGTEMIVWGGFNNMGARYSPATDSWMPTSRGATVPIARTRHTMLWTGSEMILWGGLSGAVGTLSSGARYDPATDHWKPTAEPQDLPRRYYHGAVWTGTEMIVWGGFGQLGYLDTGSRYDATNDTWTPTSTAAGVPAGRLLPHAFWTGKEMLVWGGLTNRGVNTGGLYEPIEDVWRPTSTGSNVPLPGRLVAVWTGSEMITWGAYQSRSGWPVEVTGGRFDPVTNAWTSLPKEDLWTVAPRYETTAVWTGEEMIVWGGRTDQNQPLDSGGRYHPGKDAWTATSLEGSAPEPRYGHTAVWTGTEMIVWGGRGIFGELQNGGRYDSNARRWITTSTGPNVPCPRSYHTAVWTGTEMIVWGTDFGWSSTGGQYCGLPIVSVPDAGPVPRMAARTLERKR